MLPFAQMVDELRCGPHCDFRDVVEIMIVGPETIVADCERRGDEGNVAGIACATRVCDGGFLPG